MNFSNIIGRKTWIAFISALLIAAELVPGPLANAQGMNNQVTGPVISASSGDVAAAVATATFAAPSTGAWILTGFEITGQGATAVTAIVCTITGLKGGTISYNFLVPAGATVAFPPVVLSFPDGLNGVDLTAVVLSCPSFGSGNLHAAVVAHAKLVR